MFTRRQFVLGWLAAGAHAHAQQLAHAGWRGNSITPEAWWRHAAFVRCVAPTYTFAQITHALGSFVEVGADTIVLPDVAQQTSGLFAPEFGTEDELDALLREASARRVRVVLTMPLSRASANPDAVRFWMTRGIAGIDLGQLTDVDNEALRTLRSTLDRYPGQRILIGSTPVATDPRKRDPLTLHIVSAGGTSAPNQLVEISAGQRSTVAPDAPGALLPGVVPSLSSLLPLFLMGGAPILDSRLIENEVDRAALRQALQVRNTHAVFRSGTLVRLTPSTSDLQAWVVRSRSGRDAMLIAVNNGKVDQRLSLASALTGAKLRGTYVTPLLRSDGGMGSVNAETGTLPPGAAIVGDLHADNYASSTTLDLDAPPPGTGKHSRRRRRRR